MWSTEISQRDATSWRGCPLLQWFPLWVALLVSVTLAVVPDENRRVVPPARRVRDTKDLQ